MTDTLQQNSALAMLLEKRLMEWEKARQRQELKMLECYQDVMRIARDDDTKNTGVAKANKAKALFIGSTRNKVRAARAKINDALFGSGKMPFDTTPTNEKLAPYADVVEKIITEQLERMKFKSVIKAGVNTLATYGTGFLFGPFVRKETLVETSAQDMGGSTQLVEQKYEFDFPYFELGNTLDVIPDAEARDVPKGLGVFWVTMESPHTVAAWKADKAYKNVDAALLNPGQRGTETGSERADQMRGQSDYWFKNDRIKVARFFGKVPKTALAPETDEPATDGELDDRKGDELVDVVVIMAGGVVVKVDESPYGDKNPTHRCVYEAVEHEMWGVGVGENNAPHQKVTNAAFRLFMEGKGMALLGTATIDRSKFLPTEDFRKFPGKVYQAKPGLTADERKEAIVHHVEPDITGGWMDVIRMSEQFSDDDTGITKYTQGDDARNLNKTASGISMIMSASSLPIKEVIQNIDEMWIEPVIECLIEWDLKYLEPETVQKIHGDEAGKLWAQIKQLGKSSFMDWQATGTSSFMQKEVLTNKIRAFAEFALSNPLTAQKIDVTELLQQTWDVMEIGKESPVLDPDGANKLPPEVQQHMEQQQQQVQQLGDALGAAGQHVDKIEEELKKKDAEKAEALRQAAEEAQRMADQAVADAVDQARLELEKAHIASETALKKAAIDAVVKMKIAAMTQPAPDAQAGAEAGMDDGAQEPAEPDQNQALMMEALARITDAMEQMSRPRESQIKVNKQADGSFVGTRTEL